MYTPLFRLPNIRAVSIIKKGLSLFPPPSAAYLDASMTAFWLPDGRGNISVSTASISSDTALR